MIKWYRWFLYSLNWQKTAWISLEEGILVRPKLLFFFISYKRNNENILAILKCNVSFSLKLISTDFQIFFLILKLLFLFKMKLNFRLLKSFIKLYFCLCSAQIVILILDSGSLCLRSPADSGRTVQVVVQKSMLPIQKHSRVRSNMNKKYRLYFPSASQDFFLLFWVCLYGVFKEEKVLVLLFFHCVFGYCASFCLLLPM